mmetsp:Transcript_15102/g.25690  ORF Transcript_15102/g.25690 Transcript_15102/m.25690 type:complete len:168 (+) Transcript_15102:450-953(+)
MLTAQADLGILCEDVKPRAFATFLGRGRSVRDLYITTFQFRLEQPSHLNIKVGAPEVIVSSHTQYTHSVAIHVQQGCVQRTPTNVVDENMSHSFTFVEIVGDRCGRGFLQNSHDFHASSFEGLLRGLRFWKAKLCWDANDGAGDLETEMLRDRTSHVRHYFCSYINR